MDETMLLHLTIHYLEGLKTREKLTLWERFGSYHEVARLDRAGCERIVRRAIRSRLFDPREAGRRAERDAPDLTPKSFGYTFYWDSTYPPLLRAIHDPPFLLFYRGRVPGAVSAAGSAWFERPSVAVVGTRFPTGSAFRNAFDLGVDFAEHGVPVVSGLAVGVDEAAHRGVVEAGGTAIAVLGNGIDTVYPGANRGLARSIIETGGCVLSEYGPGTSPRRYHFPARNRIIAGCARSTVVVEAPERSGALITADFALEEGRDLFVHHAGLHGRNSGGLIALARDGAEAVGSARDVLERWNTTESKTGMQRALFPG